MTDEHEEEQEQEEEEEGEEEQEEQQEQEKKQEEDKNPAARNKALSEANDRLARKLKRKDKEAEEAKRKLKEIEDAGKEPDQKLTEENAELRAESANKDARIAELETRVRLLTHEDVAGLSAGSKELIESWVTPRLEIDEDDGEDNLDEILSELKRKNPKLFEDVSANGEENDEDQTRNKKIPSGRQPQNKDRSAPNQSELTSRFPALQGRTKAV